MDDYINRQAVETFLRSRNYCLDTDADIEYVVECLSKEIPAADVRPVEEGEWIVRQRHEHYPSCRPYEELVCPFCGRTDHNGDGCFCGYCGADMRTIGQRLSDISAEEDLFPELTAEEKAENKAEAKRMIGGADG